jgi:serpin B
MRRWRRWTAPLIVVTCVAAACGDDGASSSSPVSFDAVPVADRARPGPDDDPHVAGDPMLGFGHTLLGAVADGAGAGAGANVILSPASIAVALAMMEPGTVEDAQVQVRDLLGIEDPAEYHAAMNALEQSLETRQVESFGDEGEPGELTARIANAMYLQRGYPFEPAYLETVGRHYGPVLDEVDFPADPDGVAHDINAWVADATEDRITDLIPDGTFDESTVMTLVNALHLHASWSQTFDAGATDDAPFTRLDGSQVEVPLMHGSSDASVAGDGWVGATKDYVGGLAAQFVLPDEGRFDEVAADLPAHLAELDQSAVGADLALPRFETRFDARLREALQAVGLTAPFQTAQLLGIADDPRLVLDEAIHQTFLAMDEEGTEAAAATALGFRATGAPVGEPVPVVLDRPFLFRIVDRETGATLFLGRVMDPSA